MQVAAVILAIVITITWGVFARALNSIAEAEERDEL